MKKFLYVFIGICFIMLCFSCFSMDAQAAEITASGTCGDDLTWTLDSDGLLTVSGTGAMVDYAAASGTPWYRHREKILRIAIADGVTAIGSYAFADCTNLTKITLYGEVYLGDRAFMNCQNLAVIEGKGPIPTLGEDVFPYLYQLPVYHPCNEKSWTYGNSGLINNSYFNLIPIHNLPEYTIVKAATCTTDEVISGLCDGCGETVTVTVSDSANGHSYDDNGTCTVCGASGKIVLNLYGICGSPWNDSQLQVYENGVLIRTATFSAAGADQMSITYYRNREYIFKWVPGSQFEACSFTITLNDEVLFRASESDCEGFTRGQIVYTISNSCNHSYKAVVTAPTCMEDGYTTYTCACGDSYVADVVDALGHRWVEATCTQPKRCTRCGTKDGSALGHNYVNGVCTLCGETFFKITADKDTVSIGDIVTYTVSMGPVENLAAVKLEFSVPSALQYVADSVTEADGLLELFDDLKVEFNENSKLFIAVSDNYSSDAETVLFSFQCVVNTTEQCDAEIGFIIDPNNVFDTDYTNIPYTTIPVVTHIEKHEHNYEVQSVVEPTCTQPGYTTYLCMVCGETDQTEQAAPGHQWKAATCTSADHCAVCGMESGSALGHSYVDGVCTTCGEKDPDYVEVVLPVLTLQNPTLAFEDEILYNVYFNVDDMSNIAEMGMVTFAERDVDGTVDNALEVIPGYVANADGSYTVHSNGIPAKMLGDAVYFKVYAKLSDGSYVYSGIAGYHAVLYANTVLKSDATSAKAKALVVAMLNYGAAAQVDFDYKADSLMNAGLTAEQLALVEDYSESMVAQVPAAGDKAGGFVLNNGYSDVHPTVSFEGAFSINYYFTPKYTPDDGVTFYYWNLNDFNNAEVLTPANATGTVKMTSATGVYTAPVEGIAAKQIDEPVYVAGMYTNGGMSYLTPVIGYSLGNYCKNIAANGNAFGAATAVYGYYAKAYFA